MVEMACGKCTATVEALLTAVEGVSSAEASLGTQTVSVRGTASSGELAAALEEGGRKARLIGSGGGDVFNEELAEQLGTDLRTLRQSVAAVAEFKGSAYGHGECTGVVRFVQVDRDALVFEAELSGLAPGAHALAVQTSGNLVDGLASAGAVYAGPEAELTEADARGSALPAGALGTIVVGADGRGAVGGRLVDARLKSWDVIGRALGVYDAAAPAEGGAGIAAVIARSAGVGDNRKKVCQCDGTLIWESGADDFLKSA